MNTRCHYCGWSFSLSRDALEAAVSVALAANEKMHMEHCPRCRRVIKLPVEQLRRALPANWSPAEVATPAEPEPVAEVAEPVAAETSEATADKPKRRRRGASAATTTEATEDAPPAPATAESKSPSGKTAAKAPAAKKTARKQSKP